ncbi:hypothetical protein B5S28_g2048 [[Candida] boidinii]|uniref:Unnamed protein product n=1 Tax=Candida boidinii TaxID=5477 RepID=A0ACB5TYP3_CANBO|nr:hypothetical protein B5S28_g2048 [[Candida] boidinii]OWB61077.1 hypothetical protein B5S29_g1961 [[Candida] boidinii]GME86549.1 unnamed protein product [[Candida] boidinii]GME98132.1 unnamed protein product [[Candida] boidinii]
MTFVYLDISIGGKPIGRVVLQLYDNKAPKSTQNFLKLCQNGLYKNTYFHRVIKNFMIQSGDFEFANNNNSNKYINDNIGTGGYSSFKENNSNPKGHFSDENLNDNYTIDTKQQFLLFMAKEGNEPDKNTSQFFITTAPSSHLLGKYTLFGEVYKGKSTVRTAEKVSVLGDSTDKEKLKWLPVESEKVLITDCGEWNESMTVPVYNTSYNTIGGDIYEEYPDDNIANLVNFNNPEESLKVAETIKESATLLFKQKNFQEAYYKYKKSLRYVNELIPDKDSEGDLELKFFELKKKLFLNLSLICLKLNDFQGTVDYCGYLLQMDDKVKISNLEHSKIFYRLGMAYKSLNQNDVALEMLTNSQQFNPSDAAITKEIETIKVKVEKEKEAERKKYSKFFN